MTDNYTPEDIAILRVRYIPTDPRTWPYHPIIMPSLKGKGPAKIDECDEIAFEVWDQRCNSVDSFPYLCDAIAKAMILNKELFKEADND